jgi:hypothetical protein
VLERSIGGNIVKVSGTELAKTIYLNGKMIARGLSSSGNAKEDPQGPRNWGKTMLKGEHM